MSLFGVRSLRVGVCLLAFSCSASAQAAKPKHNVIVFVADGLRRGSVNELDTPTLWKLRHDGVDFADSHSVFPTFTTANASVIATGHGTGDTGDYSNVIYPGVFLTKPDAVLATGERPTGSVVPFLESDDILADMNAVFHGNYLGERTLLSVAHEQGFNVAAIGKVGPVAIQEIEAVGWSRLGFPSAKEAILIDDQTGQKVGFLLPATVTEGLDQAGLAEVSPLRTNGYDATSQWNNGNSGDAANPGTLAANHVQEQWFADVATKVLLPQFTEGKDPKPFVLLFWSRDPDGTQHNQGDSLQSVATGINGDTSKRALRNADHCLKELLDWLDAHPAVKANTDVVVTSDHGFATISRREIAADGTQTGEPSAALSYELQPGEAAEPEGTLPPGFLAIDLGIRMHFKVFDPAVRATAGASAYQELIRDAEKAQRPATGSALLGDLVTHLDGSDAKLIVAANGGSDLIYVPSQSDDLVKETVGVLTQLDYVGGIFVNDRFCPAPAGCPGALPMSAIGMIGASSVPHPDIVVSFKSFLRTPGDLQSTVQIADTTLQEGQGQHGGLSRAQTLNNMAAFGPDFKQGYVDESPMGNIDIAPTVAKILGIDLPSTGKLKGRVLSEALTGAASGGDSPSGVKTLLSPPGEGGIRTLLEYQEIDGHWYSDRACLVDKADAKRCP